VNVYLYLFFTNVVNVLLHVSEQNRVHINLNSLSTDIPLVVRDIFVRSLFCRDLILHCKKKY